MKTVYILGAGCSVDDGAPTVNNFFKIAFSKVYESLTSPSLKQSFDNVKNQRAKLLANSTIEEFFSYIDTIIGLTSNLSEISRNDFHFEKEKSGTIAEFEKLRSDLLILISTTLKVCLTRTKSSNHSELRSIIDDHDRENELYGGKGSSIISFNWDILVDNQFKSRLEEVMDINVPSSHVNYGTYFKVLIENGNNYTYAEVNRNTTPILKLHGSLNWCYCEPCKIPSFIFAQKIADILFTESKHINCPVCNKRLKPLMIPPTFNKLGSNDTRNEVFSQIWFEARLQLITCKRIVIIGYSFPEIDISFRLLFRNALQQNYNNRKEKVPITVVDMKEYMDDKIAFEAHYKKVLKGLQIDVNFNYDGFNRFLKSNLNT